MIIAATRAAKFSIATQVATRGLNLGLSILLVRLASKESVGYYTLLIASAQLICTLGRIGTNYSYAVLLPQQTSTNEINKLTSTYSITSLATSAIIAIFAIWQLNKSGGIPSYLLEKITPINIITFTYLLSDSLSETIWSIHLAKGKFKYVFLRDVWVALSKGTLPLIGCLILGPIGILLGLGVTSFLNCGIAIRMLYPEIIEDDLEKTNRSIFNIRYYHFSKLRTLCAKGLPFFSVPLATNMILWPILLNYVNTEGLNNLDGLRIAQICAQSLGLISGSLMPVLLIKSSENQLSGKLLNQQSFKVCWLLSIIIFSLFTLLDTNLLPFIFGSASGGAISLARIFVLAAGVQGLSQIPLQRPMPTKMLVRISMLQVVSLIAAALIMIVVPNIQNGLIAYSSITLISPLLTIIFLPALLGEKLISGNDNNAPELIISSILLITCYQNRTEPILMVLILGGLLATLIKNREFMLQTIRKFVRA